MSVILILFFTSLIGITIMIWKKLVLLKKQPIIVIEEDFLIELPDLKDVRYIATKKTKKIAYVILVKIFRFSIRSSKFLKRKHKEAKQITKYIIRKYIIRNREIRQKEVSGFLKMVSEYKHIVKELKEKVKEEESL